MTSYTTRKGVKKTDPNERLKALGEMVRQYEAEEDDLAIALEGNPFHYPNRSVDVRNLKNLRERIFKHKKEIKRIEWLLGNKAIDNLNKIESGGINESR